MQIKRCVDNGVLPYVAVKRSGSGGSIVCEEFRVDRFVYDKVADLYVCPAGEHLVFNWCCVRGGMKYRVYKCRVGVCLSCRFFMTKCTRNKRGRVIWRWVHEDVVDEMKMRVRANFEVMNERMRVVEHLFGTVKRGFGASYLLLKGFRKVCGEVGLLLFSYNLRRAINILGVKALMGALARV